MSLKYSSALFFWKITSEGTYGCKTRSGVLCAMLAAAQS